MIFKEQECKHKWRILRSNKTTTTLEGKPKVYDKGSSTVTETPIYSKKDEIVIEEFCELCGKMRARVKVNKII